MQVIAFNKIYPEGPVMCYMAMRSHLGAGGRPM